MEAWLACGAGGPEEPKCDIGGGGVGRLWCSRYLGADWVYLVSRVVEIFSALGLLFFSGEISCYPEYERFPYLLVGRKRYVGSKSQATSGRGR
jgi:hypothetical protein